MKDQVKEAHATMEKSLKEHKRRTEEVENEYATKERNLHSSLRKKMD